MKIPNRLPLVSFLVAALALPLACSSPSSDAAPPADDDPDGGPMEPEPEPEPEPRFLLELSSDKLPVLQGGHATLDVSVEREDGFEGDVVVSADGLPEGVVLKPLTIGAGETSGVLELEAPEGTAHSLPTEVTVLGTSGDLEDTRELTVTVYGRPGSVDTSFQGGSVMVPVGGADAYAYAMAAQADGKILIAGTSKDNYGDFAVLRLTRDGDVDESFGESGVVTADVGGGADVARAIAVDAKDRIVVAGTTNSEAGLDFAVVRYLPDGTLDETFGDEGKTVVSFSDDADTAYAVAIQSDGKIVVAGDTNLGSSESGVDFALLRLDEDGALDEDFGDAGLVTTSVASFTGRDSIYAIGLQVLDGEERIVAAGGEGDFTLTRYLPDGSLDESFGEQGKVSGLFGSTIGAARAVALTADGEVLVAGHAHHDFALAKLSTGGTLVEDFGDAGKVLTPVSADNWDEAVGLRVDEDAKILVAGWTYEGGGSSGNTALLRYDAGGTLDEDFGQDGIVVTEVAAPTKSDQGSALLLQQDARVPSERILVAGIASDGYSQFAVTRFWR